MQEEINSGYQWEKFSSARSALMLPHPRGESESIAIAFHECHHALHTLNRELLDDTVRDWIQKVEDFMDTDGLLDPDGRGLWTVKADLLTEEQRFELSNTIDELASYFSREFWSN